MKYVVCFFLMLVSFSLPLAAKNAQKFRLPTDVAVGQTRLPEGECSVSWSEPAGSQVELTLKTQKATITVTARVVEEEHSQPAVLSSTVNGVRQLTELHTKKLKFILPAAGK